jgi:hypothetical protein
MDDGTETFESETISRGIEKVNNPYLALLASATPHDLAQFMRPGSPYWHDGFWPRFALVTPMADEEPSMQRQPQGRATLPAALVEPLQYWHRQLGIPQAVITEVMDAKGKPSGTFKAKVEPLPCRTLKMSDAVYEAFYDYNDALIKMIQDGNVQPDFDACYGRFHMKALRIAMLLASLQRNDVIEMNHWAYAQGIAEQWRHTLHQLVENADKHAPQTREERLEEKIEQALVHKGALTAREINRGLWGYSARDINTTLQGMVAVGRLTFHRI